jgi:hypothetical protein
MAANDEHVMQLAGASANNGADVDRADSESAASMDEGHKATRTTRDVRHAICLSA